MAKHVRLAMAVGLVSWILADASLSEEVARNCVQQTPIEGKWRAGGGNNSLTLELRPDGAFVAVANNWATGAFRRESGTATGKWKVIDGRFTGSISTSELQGFAIGYAWDDEVVLVSTRYLILRNAAGAFEGYVRAE